MGTQIHTPKSHKNSWSTPKEEFLSEEKKDLESLLHTKNRELETAIDKIFASFWLQLPHFSLGEFIEHTWHDNDRLLKRLRWFLEKEP